MYLYVTSAEENCFKRLLLLLVSFISTVKPELRCSPLCAPGETAVSGRCAKLVNLGEQCDEGASSLRKCVTAFSSCQGGWCRCMDGFAEEDGHCQPLVSTCPGHATAGAPCSVYFDDCAQLECIYGDSQRACSAPGIAPSTGQSLANRFVNGYGCLPKGHSPAFTVAKNGSDSSLRRAKRHEEVFDLPVSCPAGQFCYVYGSYIINECKVKAFGRCCTHTCPVGNPHPTATCERSARQRCADHEGYYCRRTFLTGAVVETFGREMDEHFLATCCPSHCPSGMVALNEGHCIPQAQMGEPCWRQEQCPYTFSCIKGICQCPEGKSLTSNSDYRCKSSRSPQPTRLPQLGESCIDETFGTETVCGPDNSICDQGVCVCACGLQPIGNKCFKKFGPCPADSDVRCVNWARAGECQRNPDWMKPNCAQSCDAC